ncbi:MAG: ribokinase [Proteobacteria bacterium]|nr:ribokinase [Pseudomonadota bacterium]
MIVVFGSLNIDLVLPVVDFPRPGETTFCDDYVWLSGGKGMNQAVAAARAGSHVTMVGCVGNDGFGETLLTALKADKIETKFVKRSSKSSGCATVMVDNHGENQILVARGANADVVPEQLDEVKVDANTLCVLQMEVPIASVEYAVRNVKKRGGRVMLNVAPSRPFDYNICESVDILVLNEVEAQDMAIRLGLTDGDSEEKIAQMIAKKFDLFCIVTLGGDGSIGCHADGEIIRVEASRFGEVVDTTGAGDCYCGVLAASIDQGYSYHEAMARASVASGLSVLVRGAQTGSPTKSRIDEAFSGAGNRVEKRMALRS